MHRRKIVVVFLALAIAATICGCARTKQYAELAGAGTSYVTAMEKLLDSAARAVADSSSEKILIDREVASTTEERYRSRTEPDKQRIAALHRIRDQVQLLGQYFAKLQELATSEEPAKVQTALEGLAGELDKANEQLKLTAAGQKVNLEALPKLGNVVAKGLINRALREEFERRGPALQASLYLQEEAIKVIGDDLKNDLEFLSDRREERLVIAPLLAGMPQDRGDWIEERRRILTERSTIVELDQAAKGAAAVRELVESIAAGNDPRARSAALAERFRTILTLSGRSNP